MCRGGLIPSVQTKCCCEDETYFKTVALYGVEVRFLLFPLITNWKDDEIGRHDGHKRFIDNYLNTNKLLFFNKV